MVTTGVAGGSGGGGRGEGYALTFFAKQQNIFRKRFQFVTIKFFVFFRTNKEKLSKNRQK